MRILTRYLIARFLGYFATFLVVSISTISVVEMMLNLGDMLQGDGGFSSISSYLLIRLPAYYLRDLSPIVAFGAAFLTLGMAARRLELLAAKAGGLSPRRLTAPLLAAALALAGAAFVLNETWVLEATRRWNQRDADSNPIRFREGSFWYQRGRTIYNIGDADRTTNTLRGVRIFELDRRGRLLRSITAPSATLDADDHFHFESPRVLRFDAEERGSPPAAEQHEGTVQLALRDETGTALMNADISVLSVGQLSEVVDQYRREGHAATRPRALLHARLAEPFAVLLFVFGAIPLGARAERSGAQGLTLPALYGIAMVAVFFGLRSALSTLTANGLLAPSPAPWLLIAVFTAWGSWHWAEMPS